jgi:hypothetical protein
VDKSRVYTLNGQQFRVSEHAAQAALDMALDPEEVLSVLRNPRRVDPHRTRDDAAYWSRGRVSAVVAYDVLDPNVFFVVTFLWSSRAGWDIDADTAPMVRQRTPGLPARERSYA